MTNLSNDAAIRDLIDAFESAVVDIERTREQWAVTALSIARDDLIEAYETVRIGGRIAE